jgi:hypothetical protein
MKRPMPDYGTKGSKRYLGVVRYPIIARQFADARAVDGGNRREHMQINRALEAVCVRPSRPFPLLSLSLGLAH